MKLIKLNEKHYIIVDGFEVKEGDVMYDIDGDIGIAIGEDKSQWEGNMKITHSTQPIDGDEVGACFTKIKQLSLSEVEELFGYSVEKLANLHCEEQNRLGNDCNYDSFIKGFNTYKELTKDKLFTIDDMIAYTEWLQENASRNAAGGWVCFDNHFYSKTNGEVFNKWYQPKSEWEVEFINGKLTLKQ